MARGRFLIFCAVYMAGLAAMDDADGMRLCVNPLASPNSCSSRTGNTGVDLNNISDCSGGSYAGLAISNFDVGGGCSATAGSGSYSSPQVQIPTGVSAATNAAGPHCYCQIKNINGNIVAASPRWVYDYSYGLASFCASICADACASSAQGNSGFRSALFDALE